MGPCESVCQRLGPGNLRQWPPLESPPGRAVRNHFPELSVKPGAAIALFCFFSHRQLNSVNNNNVEPHDDDDDDDIHGRHLLGSHYMPDMMLSVLLTLSYLVFIPLCEIVSSVYRLRKQGSK